MTGTEAVSAQAAVPRIPGTGKPGPRSDQAADADPEGREDAADFPACFAEFAEGSGGGSVSANAGQQRPANVAMVAPAADGVAAHSVTETALSRLSADNPAPRIQASALWSLAGDTIDPAPAHDETDGKTSEPPATGGPCRDAEDGLSVAAQPDRTGTALAAGDAAAAILPKASPPQPPRTAVVASGTDRAEEPVHDLLAKLLSAAKAMKQSGPAQPESRAGGEDAFPLPAEPVPSETTAGQGENVCAPPLTAIQTVQPPSGEPDATTGGAPAGQSLAPPLPRRVTPKAGTNGEMIEPLSVDSGEGDADSPVASPTRFAPDAAVASASSGPAKDGNPTEAGKNTPPPVRRDPQFPVDRAVERGPRPDPAVATGLDGAPAATNKADAHETARDASILAMGYITAVRQESHFAPVVTPQSPAQQVAERLTAELTADPPPSAGRSSTAAEAQSPPVKILHIQLNPPELGPLTVRMAMRNGALDLHMVVGNPETAQLINGDRDAISGVLRVAGYMVDGVSVQTAITTRPEASSLFGDPGAGAQQQQQGQTAQGWQQSGGHNSGQPWQREGAGQETLAGTGDETREDGGAQRIGGDLYL